ncbi:MAG: hypothetical protein SFU55_04380 [Methylophilus sp.]|nr:hypothetical protein [Methylophilus sp.]
MTDKLVIIHSLTAPPEQNDLKPNRLIYFNKDWNEEYGGYLDVWNKEVTELCGYFAPSFNRACGFVQASIAGMA